MEAPVCDKCERNMELFHQCPHHPLEGYVWVCKPCQMWNIRGCVREAIATGNLLSACMYAFKDAFRPQEKSSMH